MAPNLMDVHRVNALADALDRSGDRFARRRSPRVRYVHRVTVMVGP
jgi:hypothetical protein